VGLLWTFAIVTISISMVLGWLLKGAFFRRSRAEAEVDQWVSKLVALDSDRYWREATS
jgi:hypothetical protein